MLGPYFKSCEGCDYDNKPIDLPFQNWKLVEFSSLFAGRSFCCNKSIYLVCYIYILLVRLFLVMMFTSCFRKSIFV